MRRVSSKAIDCRLQVFLMTSKIDEGDDLARVITDLLGRLAVGVVNGTALRVEAENLVGDGGGTTGLDFVQVTKHVETGSASSVI